jgi:hypothetical protein
VPSAGVKDELLAVFASLHDRSLYFPPKYKDKMQEWLDAVVHRRCERVTEWLKSWLIDADGDALPEEGDVRNLVQNVRLQLQDLRNRWKLCGSQCASCFHLCLLERDHPGAHDCSSVHDCDGVCSFCREDIADVTPEIQAGQCE